MSTLLWIVAGYIVFDRIVTISMIGQVHVTTIGEAILRVITGAAVCCILITSAVGGVTP